MTEGAGHMYMGWQAYERNELDTAVEHFQVAVRMRDKGHVAAAYLSLMGLVFAYQAQGAQNERDAALDLLNEYVQETFGKGGLPEVDSTRARIAMRSGDPKAAIEWANGMPWE